MEFPSRLELKSPNLNLHLNYHLLLLQIFSYLNRTSISCFYGNFRTSPTPIVTNPSTTSSELLSIEDLAYQQQKYHLSYHHVFLNTSVIYKNLRRFVIRHTIHARETTTLFSTSNIDSWSIEITHYLFFLRLNLRMKQYHLLYYSLRKNILIPFYRVVFKWSFRWEETTKTLLLLSTVNFPLLYLLHYWSYHYHSLTPIIAEC